MSLHPEHKADLRKSGLSDEMISKAGIRSVPPDQINKIMGWDAPVTMLAFPYLGADGFARHKLFPALLRKGETRAQKYHQPKGSEMHLYRPPGFDANADIYIVEGEKKTLKGQQEGLNCLGISGLWNWKTKGEEVLIKDFNLYNFKGKQVYLVPDNDWKDPQKNLTQAVYRFGYLLMERGAIVQIIQLPEGNEKVGLDDYLIEHSVAEFHALPVIPVKSLKERVAEATPENYKNVLPEMKRVEDPIEKAILCKSMAKQLGISKSVIDQVVNPSQKEESLNEAIVEDVEPWETSVSGGELLNEVHNVISQHVVMEQAAVVAGTLWIVLTYCYDAFRILPILAVTSPDKRCGKTTLLEVLAGLTNRALLASNITPSAIFRTIEKHRPCLLIDEADTFLKDNEELRGVVNSGHTRQSAFVIRTNSNTMEVERFSTWGPKAISLIGSLPDTLNDRSISIRMKRKIVSEKVKKVSLNFVAEHLNLRRKLKRWSADNAEFLKGITPAIPETGNDRAEDNWLPLLSIAELAGGEWPERARKAMLTIEELSDTDTVRQILLRDIKTIFDGLDKISSKELVERLVEIEDHPWSDWSRGKPISQNGLARLLKPFGIASNTIRFETERVKGYRADQFKETFKRYITPTPPIQSVTTGQPTPVKGLREFQSVTKENDVTVANQRKPVPVKECHDVTVEKGGTERKQEEEVYEDVRI